MPVSCRAGAYSRYDFVVAPSGHLLATPLPLFSVVRGGGNRTWFPNWTLMGRILTRLLVPVWCKVCRWVRCSGHRWWISFVGVGGAIDCVPHARPSRRRYLRMVGFRVFDYVYKHVRPYIVFVPGLTMYKHLRTFRWRGFTMGTILRARSCKHIFSHLVDFPYHCYLFYRDLDLAWPYLSFLHALRATSCMYVGIVGRRCLI